MNEKITEMKKEIRVGLNLIEQDEYTTSMNAISAIAAETVARTLGPYARTTIIDDGDFAYPTKDGWTVLSRLKFPDPVHQSMFKLIRNISFRIVDMVGDGTTTAMVTANHFVEGMVNAINSGELSTYRQADVVESLKRNRDLIIDRLNARAIQIKPLETEGATYDSIYDVAYIASNGNVALAQTMQKIYQETHNPNVLVDMSGPVTEDITYEIQNGYRLDCAPMMMQRYINTSELNYVTEGRPHIFVIFDHNVNYNSHSQLIDALATKVNIMSNNLRTAVSLVLMAPHFDDVMASTISASVDQMLAKNPNSIPSIMLVQIPEMTRGDQRNYMRDFAAIANAPITNATKVKIFNDMRHNESTEDTTMHIHSQAMDINEYSFTTAQALLESCMGTVYNATFSKKSITLHDINYDSVLYNEALNVAKANYEQAMAEAGKSTTNLMKNLLESSERLNRLSGRLGVIHIGGASDLERQCTMDVVDDTFRACRSAFENGVVPGMNMGSIIAIGEVLKDQTITNTIDRVTLGILVNAYIETTCDILRNKHPDDEQFCWSLDTDIDRENGVSDERYANNRGLVQAVANDIECGLASCYDIVSEMYRTTEIPTVLNSVSADVEILTGIIGILGVIITSDQYLSMARYYDKTAAMRQQEAYNAKEARNKVTAMMSAFDTYVNENPESPIAALVPKLITSDLDANDFFGLGAMLDSFVDEKTPAGAYDTSADMPLNLD